MGRIAGEVSTDIAAKLLALWAFTARSRRSRRFRRHTDGVGRTCTRAKIRIIEIAFGGARARPRKHQQAKNT